MIEALTPQLLFLALMLVIALSSALTLLVSLLVLWRYRRRVLQAMAESAGGAAWSPGAGPVPAAPAPVLAGGEASAAVFRHAMTAPWQAAGRDAVAGVAFALVMSAAVGLAFPLLRTPAGVAVYAWGYAWPVVLALMLTGPGGVRSACAAVAVYFAPLLVFTLAAVAADEALFASAADLFTARGALTPPAIARAWLLANAPPTVVLVLFLGRRLRTLGPLLLALVTTATAGFVVCALALLTDAGAVLLESAATISGLQLQWLLLAALMLSIALFALLGWALLRMIRRAWLRRTVSEHSLRLDALWLFFAALYAMYYAPAGLAWAGAPLLAFAAYKIVGAGARVLFPPRTSAGARGLTFLRVFSLGRRSDRLFEALARHWRHVGPIQLITGPDVASSTVQPHQLLDFLAGRLATHFIGDARSLERRMKERDTDPDRDGRYRISSFFCHADTWQAVLARLVGEGDVVLMDLRSFSAGNAGCAHELRYLANFVPLQRCVLLIDDSTDLDFVRATLDEAWRNLDAASPNRGTRPDAVRLDRLQPGQAGLRQLLRRMSEASCAAASGRHRRIAIGAQAN